MTGGVRTTTETVHRAVYRTDGDASVNLCVSQPAAWTTTTKRREENRDFNCIRSSKSEAQVTKQQKSALDVLYYKLTTVLRDTKHRAASLR